MPSQIECGYCGTQQPPVIGDTCAKCGSKIQPLNTNQLVTMIEPATGGSSPAPRPTSAAASARIKNIDGYEILSLLGKGGMGSVYLAYEPLLNRKVALKLLSPNIGVDRAAASARFLSEATLTGRLTHAGILPIYHVGYDAQHGYYYTMRRIHGQTISALIDRLIARDPVALEAYSLTKLLGIFQRVCEAVGFAHRNGIIHRDLKPCNLIVTDHGEVFVLDWGLAKDLRRDSCDAELADREQEIEIRRKATSAVQMFLAKDEKTTNTSLLRRLQMMGTTSSTPSTNAHQILGTPGYLSPEQATGTSEISAASDVYSLGATLYELLTFRLPVAGENVEEFVANTALGKILPIEQRGSIFRLPEWLTDFVNRALALNPEHRFQDAREMAEELSQYLDGKPSWKALLQQDFTSNHQLDCWKTITGSVNHSGDGTVLSPKTVIRCPKAAAGDFKSECEFFSPPGVPEWNFSCVISETLPGGNIQPRYELRIAGGERPLVELLRNGIRVQRRLDVRLATYQRYTIKVELEQCHVRVSLDDRRLIDYTDLFPQSGGVIEFGTSSNSITVRSFKLESRGAPLQLSFMALPDRQYRMGHFAEAREMYRQLASSHPNRDEGQIALFKSGMCSTELREDQVAFEEFARLEGTTHEHYCVLGLANIGIKDKNLDWAWEALKNGYKTHHDPEVQHEMWFSLLKLIETLDETSSDEKIRRYEELLQDLNPVDHEAGQLCFEMLDLIYRTRGAEAVRLACTKWLERLRGRNYAISQVLSVLNTAGIDFRSLAPVTEAVDELLKKASHDAAGAKLRILRAELFIASGQLDEAFNVLRDAMLDAGRFSSDALWARGWQVLGLYLKGQYAQAITTIHETLRTIKGSYMPQADYLRLIEAVSYSARSHSQQVPALRNLANAENVWGFTARLLIEGAPPSRMLAFKIRQPGQLSEALFLAGEYYRHNKDSGRARDFYNCLSIAPYNRAMFQTWATRCIDVAVLSSGESFK